MLKFQLDLFANPFWRKFNIISWDSYARAISFPNIRNETEENINKLRLELMHMEETKKTHHEFFMLCSDGFTRQYRLTALQEFPNLEIGDLVEFTEHAPLVYQGLRLLVLDIQEFNELSFGSGMDEIFISGQFMPDELRLIRKAQIDIMDGMLK